MSLSLDRVRSWLRDLRSLCDQRAKAEQDIEQRFASGSADAERDLARRREEIERRFAVETRGAEARYQAARAGNEKRFRAEDRQARLAEQAERQQIVEKGEHSEKAARRQWDEATWAAETVFEAKEHHPAERLKDARRKLEALKRELNEIEVRASAVLERSHVRPAGTGAEEASGLDDAAAALAAARDDAAAALERIDRMLLLRLFQDIQPFLILIVPPAAVAVVIGFTRGWRPDAVMVGAVAAALAVTGIALGWLYSIARRRALDAHATLRAALDLGHAAFDAAVEQARSRRRREEAQLRETRDREVREARERYEPIIAQIDERRAAHITRIDEKYPALLRRIRERYEQDRAAHLEARETAIAGEKRRHEDDRRALQAEHERRAAEIRRRYEQDWAALVAGWKAGLDRVRGEASALAAANAAACPPWPSDGWVGWSPGTDLASAIPFGSIAVDMADLPGGLPGDERLAVEGPTRFEVPAVLSLPDQCSLYLESPPEGRARAVQTLQTVMMRLLTALPPGKVRFTILDPVGLGQNFAGFMHLADYNEAFVDGKIWTETRHIEQRLADLTEHMENVIQKYLRNEYETIAQYNEAAGEIAEPYRFVVACDFPANVSEGAARRLAAIISSGARCGVYTLISADARQQPPKGITAGDLRRGSVNLACADGRFTWRDPDFEALPLTLEDPPSESFVTEKLHVVGEAALDSTRVEVPFEVIVPGDDKLWSRDATADVRVPLGRCGATRLQHLALGHGTNQHALIAGKTGSGKSTLLHVLITNLALWYPPDEVEFYLVDFKKGVEFKTYATHDLPHARAVAIESDREFGLSVLHRLDEELKRRGAMFRQAGVQDLAGYRAADGAATVPRTLLIIDEFQEFFVEDDKLAQEAALLLDRLIRQGRAFGVHVLLGSQTLGGAYTLARSTMDQVGVRIALQCSESDSYLILSDDNAAARLLSRPGEAIYNDANGRVEGNSPFQIVWLPDSTRERYLGQAQALARRRRARPPEPRIVFEGNAPADVNSNHVLRAHLEGDGWPAPAGPPRAWLGEAVAIKDPTAVEFDRRGGSNVVIVGQREDAALAMLTMSMIGLAAQLGPGAARFVILDGVPADSPQAGYLERAAALLPHDARVIAWRDVDDAFADLDRELRRRMDGEDGPAVFTLICGIQRFRMLRRRDEDFSFSSADKPPAPDRQLADLLREGPACGMHALVWCDTLNSLERTFERQGLREFDHRVLFQMSAPDSTLLIDSPAAGKLGLQRALLANEERGTLEKFRPYAVPDEAWLAEAGRALAEKVRGASPEVVVESDQRSAISDQ